MAGWRGLVGVASRFPCAQRKWLAHAMQRMTGLNSPAVDAMQGGSRCLPRGCEFMPVTASVTEVTLMRCLPHIFFYVFKAQILFSYKFTNNNFAFS